MRRWAYSLTAVSLAVTGAVTGAGPLTSAAPAAADISLPIYLDRHYSPVERATDLVSRLSLAEKAQQMDSSQAPAIRRLGVAAYGWWNEANHGINALTTTPSGNATTQTNTTSYPSDLSMGSTWNPNLVYQEAGKISDEAREIVPNNTENLDFYAPTVNLSRDPRWGRNDESWSEDPTLTADLASQYVDGLQGETQQGVLLPSANGYYKAIATLKHYAANNSEVNRRQGSSDMDERTLREYYTAQFASIIKQSNPGSIMSSYNEVNGTPAAANVHLMDTLARQTFGFKGYFTSDCDAIEVIQKDHHWQPAGASTPLDQYGRTAYANSAGEDLDCNAGYSDQYNYGNTIPTAIAQQITTQTGTYNYGDVDTSIVRLFTARIETGEFDAQDQVPWVAAARARVAPGTWTSSEANHAVTETPARLNQAKASADQSIVLLNNSNTTKQNGSTGKLLPLKVPASGAYKVAVVGYYANPTGALVLGGYSSIQSASGQAKEVSAYQGLKTAIQAKNPAATVDFLPGVTGGTTGATLTKIDAASVAASANYDAVVVVVGTDSSTSAEDHDRTSLDLPGAQAALISQVEAANPNTVVYMETVGEVNIAPFQSTSPALVWSSYNGEEQGTALADVLLGKVNPSGHLPFTWYANESQLPAITDYNIRPTSTTDGRTYMYFTGTPSYPFGYGKSYTTFAYSHITVSSSHVTADGTVKVSAKVTNKGGVSGAEVPQLYVTTPFEPASAQRPVKRLEGFQKVALKPRQTKTVNFSVPAAQLAFFDEASNTNVVDNGTYGFQVATSAADADVKLHANVQITGAIGETPSVLTAKPIELGDQNVGISQRVMFDQNTTILPQLTVSMNDEKLFGYQTKGQSTPLPAGATVSYTSNRSSVVAVPANGTLRAVGAGIATVTAKVRYHGGSATTSFTVDVSPLQFTSAPSTVFKAGSHGHFVVDVGAKPKATLSEAGALPAGVTFKDNGDDTATISGIAPTTTGAWPIAITAHNGTVADATQQFTLYVGTVPAITSAAATTFVEGTAGSFGVVTTGYPTATVTVTGALPPGVTLKSNSDGTATLAGTPDAGSKGTYALTLTASNGLATTATQAFVLTVLAQAPTATTGVLAGTVQETFHFGTFTFSFPLPGIAVHVVQVRQTADAVPAVTTAGNGSYEFDAVPSGAYQVQFVDPAGAFVTQWYNATDAGSANQAGASTVTVIAAKATLGINASLAATPAS